MVKWLDAYGPTVPWTDIKDIEMSPAYCVSVGFIVAKDTRYIVVAPHCGPDGGVTGELKIPIKCVEKIWKLKIIKK